ncbi:MULTISPECIES: SDR family oxidoreductase [unclassified Gemella]|uniref:SDR family NAD(P)-dependent oxidoreductase n=1 Tax=unclassified Gemella TaxID=2624949 RepID=UPI001C04CC6C|nr:MULTISPECIES: SDR family oxidoreductase [unclassified Gemella]MBU0278943.1 SDR family oxidoreductase [Gemella sp. zg-1178]QWQ39052.1 SDR family oxidoreductase [Gemella sp. zg-570]
MTKIVLITGASLGLGKEFAYKYAKETYNLLLVARSENKLLEIKNYLEKKYNIRVFILVKDLSKNSAAKEVYEYCKENNLRVEILINNAGFGDFGDFKDSDLDKQTNMIDLNVRSLVQMTHYFLNEMIDKNSGKILNLASVASFMPGPKMSVYYASKAFVLSFTEALAEELTKFNIKISALCPGPTKTNFEKNADVNFSGVKMQEASEVVNYAYDKFMSSKKVIILPGLQNKILVTSVKFLPKSFLRKAVNIIQSNFRGK